MITISPLLNPQDWKDLFPITNYKECQQAESGSDKKKWIALHALKFLIALGQPENAVLKYISEHKGDGSKLNSTLTEHQLTVLHLAAMRANIAIVTALLDAGAEDRPDAHGWLAMHHAALVSDEIMELIFRRNLVRMGLNLRTPLGATCQELQVLAGKMEPKQRQPLLFRHPDGRIEKLSKAEFEKRTGLKNYREEHLYTDLGLKALWKSAPRLAMSTVGSEFTENAYKHFIESIRKLTVGQSTLAVRGSAPFMGLFAGQKLRAGTCITEYVGIYCENTEGLFPSFIPYLTGKKRYPYSYKFDQCDAAEAGNFSRFMNDGWPNGFFQTVKNKGIAERYVFTLFEDVPSGEELFVDYTTTLPTKWGVYCIAKRDLIRHFFEVTGPLAHMKELKRLKEVTAQLASRGDHVQALKTYMALSQLAAKIRYCLNTPAVLIDLIMSGLTTAKDWHAALEDEEWKEDNAGANINYTMTTTLLWYLNNLSANLNNSEAGGEIRSFFLEELSNNRNVLHLCDACLRLNCYIELNKGMSLQAWGTFKEHLGASFSKPVNHEPMTFLSLFKSSPERHLTDDDS